MTLILPTPIAEYYAAANTDDADRIAACFTPDAHVVDERHDHIGRVAIRDWAAETRRKYRFTSRPTAIAGPADAPLVTAHVAGDFPGSPVDLTYRFTLADGLVARLEIA
jgi:ketosteroid isomerase-like protein